ncbi:Zn-ribbon domain-containing OB-fold protein [Mycolicibacterium pyrenivorans]|uniref:Zn-ribbon domain-containing OB-fold protein n=1 Tax=Mycolicibacterium pyrenivorans TaxID=187102 RepID=UPI0021F3C417|nr:Zn-ribbon domain-containing OB-fold protein [Mycolicibacterium pyrenivorans]MCV7149964.1 Zn-ribbon domain-containing OB-fold protein [Mycolicibacterium pyrenivorans]
MASDTSSDAAKFAPQPTPETEPFWAGCAQGELRLQRCSHCDEFYFPPRPFCPSCWSADVTWQAVSGRGTLHSYVINHRPAPGFAADAPYAIALVQLDEGPRMMSNILGVENIPENLVLDMALEVTFEQRGDITVPQFQPAGAQR